MSAEHDDARKTARQEDLEAELAQQAAETEAAPSVAPQATPLSAAERAVERLLITAELIGAPAGFAEKVLAALRAGKAESYKRRRWFRFF